MRVHTFYNFLLLIILIATLGVSCKQSKQIVRPAKVTYPVENSRWAISYDHPQYGRRDFDVVFLPEGKLECYNPDDITPDNDEWEIIDGYIYIYMNNKFSKYRAVFLDSKAIRGTAESEIGGNWEWSAVKKE